MKQKDDKKRPGRPNLGPLAKTYPIRVKLPKGTGERLEKRAEKTGKPVVELVRNAVVEKYGPN